MEDQVLLHTNARRHGHIYKWKQLSLARRLILFFGLLLILFSIALAVFFALGFFQGTWIGSISTIFSALGVVTTTLPWVYPIDSTSARPLMNAGRNPPIDLDLTVWCERSVEKVYEKLINPNISAIVLRGLNGVGASTLANLVFRYAEEQRNEQRGPFIDKTLWFYIGARTTVADLAEELSMNLSKALPDISQLSPEHQAMHLFDYLKSLKTKRLIVLDFKYPLEQSTESLAEHLDFKELIKLLNGHYCHCTVLLTSCPWPSETKDHRPSKCIEEHYITGLDEEEGIELLQRYNVEGTDDELRSVVRLCNGHAGALVTLASILDEESVVLAEFLKNNTYIQTWMQDVTEHFLDHAYRGLSPVQKELLFAYSVYREPIKKEGAEKAMTGTFSEAQLLEAFRKLNRRNLFLYSAEKDNHQLHPLVAYYAKRHFCCTTSNQNDPAKLQEAHRKATLYYQSLIDTLPPGSSNRRIELLIELAWQLHKSGRDQEAATLILQGNLLEYIL